MTLRRLAVSCALGIAVSASAATSTTVLKTTTTWDGAGVQYLPTQCPEVDAVVVEIAPNATTSVHLHPVNSYAYVLEGEVTVATGDVVNGELVAKKTATFKKGTAFAELVDTWHRGKAGPQGVKILVWYTTEVGRPVTVDYRPDYKIEHDENDSPHCEPPRNSRK